jgi:hypothetical protein
VSSESDLRPCYMANKTTSGGITKAKAFESIPLPHHITIQTILTQTHKTTREVNPVDWSFQHVHSALENYFSMYGTIWSHTCYPEIKCARSKIWDWVELYLASEDPAWALILPQISVGYPHPCAAVSRTPIYSAAHLLYSLLGKLCSAPRAAWLSPVANKSCWSSRNLFC